MSRLPSLSSRTLLSILRKAGFEDAPKRGKGSHRALVRQDESGQVRIVIVPRGKDIPRGTLAGADLGALGTGQTVGQFRVGTAVANGRRGAIHGAPGRDESTVA